MAGSAEPWLDVKLHGVMHHGLTAPFLASMHMLGLTAGAMARYRGNRPDLGVVRSAGLRPRAIGAGRSKGGNSA
ncbi:hypothetical protein F511_27103 [Dorcoceras hygrometricum]|uniref:Uncharacterized protein n=1 Tax=Dorcoceras hygrometricum TaxID=472368 RepID=A0A2Z7D278_9LAMI|nr:hypothetical protein F511_27103 [Dorcoceras hygrometricum]